MALAERGPAPCEESAVPEAWWAFDGELLRLAKGGCARCPVRPECLAYAEAAGERWGCWGGLSERERARVRRAA
ncbi:WhiB family transcriptional regulator [Blastococcus sp. TBT05-19]|nr:WhiB family transcriptional regulator [Blastococcus sp. TBT05-19]RBY94945.1 WhiB family transcriptional regulator [Blastococcus sp. TBT05-19]